MSKRQSDNTNNATKSSITQGLPTDLGRSVGVTTATQLVWLNFFTGPTKKHITFRMDGSTTGRTRTPLDHNVILNIRKVVEICDHYPFIKLSGCIEHIPFPTRAIIIHEFIRKYMFSFNFIICEIQFSNRYCTVLFVKGVAVDIDTAVRINLTAKLPVYLAARLYEYHFVVLQRDVFIICDVIHETQIWPPNVSK